MAKVLDYYDFSWFSHETIHLVSAQNFPKNKPFLTLIRVCIRGLEMLVFLEYFECVKNEWSSFTFWFFSRASLHLPPIIEK